MGNDRPPADRSGATLALLLIAFAAVLCVGTWLAIKSNQAHQSPVAIVTDTPEPTQAPDSEGAPLVGEVRTIGDAGASPGLACPPTIGQLDDIIKAIIAHDDEGYQKAIVDGTTLHTGDRVRIIDTSGLTRVQIRVMSGDDVGFACWTEGDMTGLFQ